MGCSSAASLMVRNAGCTSEADHARHLRALFGRLQAAGVVINPGKCQFAVASLSFLGHTVTTQGITPAQEVIAIRKFPRPATEKQLRKFLGMFNFYRRFVPGCAQLLKPLHALVTPNRASRNTRIEWTSPTKEAFQACKEALATATLLNHPLPEASLSKAVDASDTAIGAVLQQRQGKQWQPLAFFSQTLSPCQSRYCAFRRELLAAYSAVRHFQPSVEAKEFHILTDHKPLTFALHSRTPRQYPREERHLDFISQFTTDISHIRGSDNEAADALSRVTISAATLADDAVDYHLVSREQRQDTSLTPLLEGQTSLYLERVKIPNSCDDLLCNVSLGYPRSYILPSLHRRFFDAYHQHHGIRATQHLIRSKVVWPAINKDVRQWCRSCLECQRNKIHRHTKFPLQTFPIPDSRFQHIHIDIVGPLPMDDGYSYILTMIDRFTRSYAHPRHHRSDSRQDLQYLDFPLRQPGHCHYSPRQPGHCHYSPRRPVRVRTLAPPTDPARVQKNQDYRLPPLCQRHGRATPPPYEAGLNIILP
ncbi:hypothetical protein C7M84_002244 [Penaeus vannamei]|uniref:RNA-directed DNA polymerase n=1 Tax=Penaeus vannamei TaxID=6689 RepID=A0A423TRE3_PENVA|nr:hypothetical protein C7M84_002244 [Penaeus vannamei]